MNSDPKKQCILFVDDEPNILQGLKRLLRNRRTEWKMLFSPSGAEALKILETEHVDIIITDLRMPEMDGVTLLNAVKKRYPEIIRFVLSGHGDTDLILQSVSVAHQFLSKPCDADDLQETITRAVRLQNIFNSRTLRGLVADTSCLPTLPELYKELSEALQSQNSTATEIAAIIARDITISARILQLVNSAFFGLTRHIESIAQAVTLVGAETINTLLLSTEVFGKIDEKIVKEYDIRNIYQHSMLVASTARRLTFFITKNKTQAEEAMLAGLLHDIGILVLINSKNKAWHEIYLQRKNNHESLYAQEFETLGITHAEIGAYLIGVWGIANPVVEAIAYHHAPSKAVMSNEFNSLAALYLANYFVTETSEKHEHPLDEDYLKKLGLLDRLDELRNCCIPAIEEPDQQSWI